MIPNLLPLLPVALLEAYIVTVAITRKLLVLNDRLLPLMVWDEALLDHAPATVYVPCVVVVERAVAEPRIEAGPILQPLVDVI